MRGVALVIGLLLVVPSTAPAAEGAATPNSSPRISLKLERVPLREALKRLFHASPGKHDVDSTIPDIPISVAVQDVSRETALRTLLRSAAAQVPGITVETSGDYFQVVKRAVKPRVPTIVSDEPGAEKRVFLNLSGVNLREAYRRLVLGSLVRIHVHETVPDVPVGVDTRGVSLPEAARAITRDAALLVPGLVIRPQGGGYVVFIDDNKPGLAGLPAIVAVPGTNEYIAKIRLRFEDASPDSYLMRFLRAALMERQLNRAGMGMLPTDATLRGPGSITPGLPPRR